MQRLRALGLAPRRAAAARAAEHHLAALARLHRHATAKCGSARGRASPPSRARRSRRRRCGRRTRRRSRRAPIAPTGACTRPSPICRPCCTAPRSGADRAHAAAADAGRSALRRASRARCRTTRSRTKARPTTCAWRRTPARRASRFSSMAARASETKRRLPSAPDAGSMPRHRAPPCARSRAHCVRAPGAASDRRRRVPQRRRRRRARARALPPRGRLRRQSRALRRSARQGARAVRAGVRRSRRARVSAWTTPSAPTSSTRSCVRLPGAASLTLIAPTEVRENNKTAAYVAEMIAQPNAAIGQVEYVEVRESMRNGGGPACLRLRIVMTAGRARRRGARLFPGRCARRRSSKPGSRSTTAKSSRRTISAIPRWWAKRKRALDELTRILPLGGDFYPFQRT